MRKLIPYGLGCLLICSQFLVRAQSLHGVDAATGTAVIPDTTQPYQRNFSAIRGIVPPDGTQLLVSALVVKGNKKTRADIILREIPFSAGQEYKVEELVDLFELAQQQLMNTALFHIAKVFATGFAGNCMEVTVEVVERWYLFPIPYFKLVDRNLNQWLVDQHASLDRVNYGVKLLYNNVTGHNDKLRLWVFNGYTQQLSASYEKPYIDRAMRWGFKLSTATGKSREINYNTLNDKQAFLKTEESFIRKFLMVSAGLTYRKKLYARHDMGMAWLAESVSDTVLAANPAYFANSSNRVSFPEWYYQFKYVKLDYLPYPTKGYATQLRISKSGWNPSVNLWQLHWQGYGSWPTGLKSFVGVQVYTGLKLPFHQPYFTRRFLGYNETFLKGYEYYVIDGVAGGYACATYTRELFRLNIGLPARIVKKRGLEYIPIRVFGKIYANSGYVYNPDPGANRLNNKMLHAGGIGIDLLTLYDITFRVEYSFNQLGQNGLFLHRTSSF